MRAPPVAQPEVLSLAYVPVADALGVAHPKGPHLVVDRPGDHGLGGLVLSLMDPPAVAGLRPALGSPQLSPSSRSPLALPRSLASHVACPGLGVGQVQVALGPQAPTRHEQGLFSCDHGEGMDDAGVHAGDDIRIEVVVLGAQGCGHIDVQPPRLIE
jgi:hypothetical protein